MIEKVVNTTSFLLKLLPKLAYSIEFKIKFNDYLQRSITQPNK